MVLSNTYLDASFYTKTDLKKYLIFVFSDLLNLPEEAASLEESTELSVLPMLLDSHREQIETSNQLGKNHAHCFHDSHDGHGHGHSLDSSTPLI